MRTIRRRVLWALVTEGRHLASESLGMGTKATLAALAAMTAVSTATRLLLGGVEGD
jgi:hypothetical protein